MVGNEVKGMSIMFYMTLREASKVWGIGARKIKKLCVEDKIEEAIHIGRMWLIPKHAKKPEDAIIKSGK